MIMMSDDLLFTSSLRKLASRVVLSQDTIKGLMTWKKFPSPAITSTTNGATLCNVWVPRRSVFNTFTLCLSVCLFVCLSLCLYVCMYVCFSQCVLCVDVCLCMQSSDSCFILFGDFVCVTHYRLPCVCSYIAVI